MALTLLTLLALGSLSSVRIDSNLVANPDFESGAFGWKFWARAADSGRMTASSESCHGGSGCLAVAHEGAQDWGAWPSLATVAVRPGEGWTWSAWTRTVSRISIPKGCASIQPRIVGYGLDSLWIDDAPLALESAAPTGLGTLSVANDSVRLDVDPIDLSMRLVEVSGADTMRIGGLPDFHFDSARLETGAVRLFVRHLSGGWNGQILSSLPGGTLRLSLTADSASPVPGDFVFPGTVATRSGQRIAIPRGTGLAWPVDGPLSTRWPLTAARFWEWQVSQSVTGASDGRTGFVLSIDQPSDARLYLEKNGGALTCQVLRQTPSKDVFGHGRSAVIAPLHGGFAEMARRHRARQDRRRSGTCAPGRARWPTTRRWDSSRARATGG